jgi:hypothetical protein
MARRTHIDPRNIEVIDDVMADVLRRLSGVRKLEIASEMHDWARTVIRGQLAAQNPAWNEERLAREVGRRILNEAF